MRCAVFLVSTVVLGRLLGDLSSGVFTAWAGNRLAFSAAVIRGFDVYPMPGTGIVTGNIYGPIMALFYVPALVVPTITGQLLAAEVMSVLVMFIPVAVLFARELRGAGEESWKVVLAALVATLAVLLAIPGTRYQLTSNCSDAPCLGFGLCSYLLVSNRGSSRRAQLLAARLRSRPIVLSSSSLFLQSVLL